MSFTGDDSPDRLLAAMEGSGSNTPSLEEGDADADGETDDEGSGDEGEATTIPAASSNTASGQVGTTGAQVAVSTASGFSSTVGQGASTLPLGQTWKLNQPMATPMAYEVTSDANGGIQTLVLHGNLDFANPSSIAAANDYLHQRRARARARAGLAPLRPSTADRAITQTQHAFIIAEYHAYAAANNGRRIPNPELTRRFNARFQEDPPRTTLSMSAYVSRHADIVAVKNSYE